MSINYSAADSLRYLAHHSLLDAALDALEDTDTGSPDSREELACDILRTLKKIVAFEARFHGLDVGNRYSDNTPVTVAYEEPYREQDTSGMWHVGTREVVATRHPSGALTHPAIDGGEVAQAR